MTDVVIFGNGPSAIMAYHQFAEGSEYSVSGFTVDQAYIKEGTLMGLPVVPSHQVETVFPAETHHMFIAIGYTAMNTVREQKYNEEKQRGYQFVTYVHPTAVLYPEVSIGENCEVGAFSVIQPEAVIGNNVIIRDNCHIGHNSKIQDHCFIAGHANVSGYAIIESNCFLGPGCNIINKVTIKKSSLIGAGVTMLEDSDENDVYLNRTAQKVPIPSGQIVT